MLGEAVYTPTKHLTATSSKSECGLGRTSHAKHTWAARANKLLAAFFVDFFP